MLLELLMILEIKFPTCVCEGDFVLTERMIKSGSFCLGDCSKCIINETVQLGNDNHM